MALKGTRATQAYDAAMKHAEAEKSSEVTAARRAAEERAAEELASLRKARALTSCHTAAPPCAR
jgi:hypothetical protein